MLPFSLTNGWNIVSDGKTIPFEAALDGRHVVERLTADRDEIAITVGGRLLVIRRDVFEQLTTRAIIAAHTTPGAHRD